jgi:hypothetical protein
MQGRGLGPLADLRGRGLGGLASFLHFLFKLPALDASVGFRLHVFEDALFIPL